MGRYILRRLVLMIPVAFLVTIIVFTLIRLSPGDPLVIYAGEERDEAVLAQLRTEYGLDRSMPEQYVSWLAHALQGDLGRSLRTRQPVLEALLERFPATLQLGFAALFLSVTIALVVGTLSAVYRNSPLDLIATGVTLAGVSLPNFFLGLVLILLFSLAIRVFPPGGYTALFTDPADNLRHLVLPAIVLAAATIGLITRTTRASMLESLSQDFVRVAHAKGLKESRIVIGHVLPNALIPVVTLGGLAYANLLTGAVMTETIFSWPGLGRYTFRSAVALDFPAIMGITLVVAVTYLIINLLVDISYALLDPRVLR